MKLWKIKYEITTNFHSEIGEEYFYLENEDNPIEYIDNFYEKESGQLSYNIKRIGGPTLILIRTRLDGEFSQTLSKDGETI